MLQLDLPILLGRGCIPERPRRKSVCEMGCFWDRTMMRAATRSLLLCARTIAFISFLGAPAAPAASGHSHHAVRPGDAANASEIREFEAAHARMMQAMALPFTGDVDVDFQKHMAPHHQGAIDMARIALRRARDPWTRQIAQQQEIAQFRIWLARHGARPPRPAHPYYVINPKTYPDPDENRAEGGRPGELVGHTWAPGSGVPRELGPRPGVGSFPAHAATQEFKRAHSKMMQAMSGPFTGDPDVDFRTHMIPHHQGAIDMAKVALRHARDPWVRQAAQAIIVAQAREIYRFRAWLARNRTEAAPRP